MASVRDGKYEMSAKDERRFGERRKGQLFGLSSPSLNDFYDTA